MEQNQDQIYEPDGNLDGLFEPDTPGFISGNEPIEQQQYQQPQLPQIEVPDGYALAGRYNNIQDLEKHASYYQSEYNKLQNSAKEAFEVKDILDRNPQLYNVLVDELSGTRTQQPLSPDIPKQSGPASDWDSIWNTGQAQESAQQSTGADPSQIQQIIDNRVNAALSEYHNALVSAQQQQVEDQRLYMNYLQSGRTEDDFVKDIEFAKQIDNLPKDQLLGLISRMRMVSEARVPVSNQGIPRSITSIAGNRDRMSAPDQGDMIVRAGRRSIEDLFKK